MTPLSFGPFRKVSTVVPGGLFHARGMFGDGQMSLHAGRYHLVYHQRGIVYTSKPADGDPWAGWPEPAGGIKEPIECLPLRAGTPAAKNRDTPCLDHDATTGRLRLYSVASPGDLPAPTPPNVGAVYAMQRAVSLDGAVNLAEPSAWIDAAESFVLTPMDGPKHERPWVRPGIGVEAGLSIWMGGILEVSIVPGVDSDSRLLFYQAMTATYRNTLCRAVSRDGGKTWFRDPLVPVWDPKMETADSFGSKPVAMHPCVARDPRGGLVLAMLGAGGGHEVSLGIWTSQDEGLTWKQAADNPIADKATFAAPRGVGAGWMLNSPWIFFDPDRGKAYVGLAAGGAPDWHVYRAGTAFWMAEADAPIPKRRRRAGFGSVTTTPVPPVTAGE